MSYDDGVNAVYTIVQDCIKKAGYDKTIQVKILSCQDATIGKYKCKYQDSTFYVYSDNVNNTYMPGSLVYVSVSNNDNSKDRFIKGTVNKLGINYIPTAPEDHYYDFIGENCISQDNIYYLDTNNINYHYKIYQYNSSNNNFKFIQQFENYIKESSSLLIGAKIKTNIDAKKQYRGHYGFVCTLIFKDNNSLNEVARTYVLDENSMTGNPYRMSQKTRQFKIFDIDGKNFIRIESIEIFNSDFPNAAGNINNKKITNGDIEISDLEFFGTIKMTEEEINGAGISFYTPNGTFFVSDSDKPKIITAQLKVKGRIATSLENIPFYWGINDITISPNNAYYNKYLGRGWKCLNNKNIIQGSEAQPDIVEWIPGSDTYIINFDQATAKDNYLKVAVIYDNNVITKEINIKNLYNKVNITIESNEGTEFYYDMGHPDLICKIDGIDQQDSSNKDKYKYYWSYESDTGVFEDLFNEDPEYSIYFQYKADKEKYENLLAAINSYSILQNSTYLDYLRFKEPQKNLEDYLETLTEEEKERQSVWKLQEWEDYIISYNQIQKIYKNKIYDVQINQITSFGTFKCSVFENKTDENNTPVQKHIGTAAITLYNKLEGEGTYSLIINNGNVVYQYDENGNAPTTFQGSLSPQQIKVLSFTLYNNLGQAIESSNILKDPECEVIWAVPIKDTLLKINYNNVLKDQTNEYFDNEYHYYKNLEFLLYDINSKYNLQKTNNQISLTINYKGTIFTAKTNFTFVKQGDPSTNGTDYIVKIVPNTKMINPPAIPIIKRTSTGKYILNFGLNTNQQTSNNPALDAGVQLLKAQLWNNGEQITINNDNITWEILYNPDKTDQSKYTSSFGLTSQGIFTYKANQLNKNPFNIIKCTIKYDNKFYYGTLPIIVIQEANSSNYTINLKENSGFYYVLYTTDGVNPQYNKDNPFEFICKIIKNNEKIDVSRMQNDENKINYTISIAGDNKLLQQKKKTKDTGLEYNQFDFIPSKSYNGYATNIAVVCQLTDNKGNLIGQIHIPIHFLLNKYGLANLNDWDGNSVKIDDEGGYILSPQIGAGSKGSDNTFTGVLMGQVKEAGKKKSQTGLFGYASGARTFFLDSQSGGALFGKNDNGRIIINPASDKAIIVSNNYWNKDNYDEKGFPIRLDKASDGGIDRKGAGMLIDLSTPQIRFGSGHFFVNADGNITAQGGGTIAGWNIGTSELVGEKIHLNKNGSIYSGEDKNHLHNSINSTYEGFFLSHEGLSIGSQVRITNTGQAHFGRNAVKNSSTTNPHWIISSNNSQVPIFKANGVRDGKRTLTRSYIGFGMTIENDGDKETAKQKLVHLKNRTDYFIPAGAIWQPETKDKNGKVTKKQILNNHPTVYLGTDGLSLGSKFSVDTSGNLISKSGTIGGWKIKDTTLIGGDDAITLNSNGSIYGPLTSDKTRVWYINNSGAAHFSNFGGHVGQGMYFSGNGFNLGGSSGGGGGYGGSGISPNIGSLGTAGLGVGTLGGAIYKASKAEFDTIYAKSGDFDDLSADITTIKEKLKYSGSYAKWGNVVTSIDAIGLDVDSKGKPTRIHIHYYYTRGLVAQISEQPDGASSSV